MFGIWNRPGLHKGKDTIRDFGDAIALIACFFIGSHLDALFQRREFELGRLAKLYDRHSVLADRDLLLHEGPARDQEKQRGLTMSPTNRWGGP